MIAYLHRYYTLGFVLLLLAPLWLHAVSSNSATSPGATFDALVWTGVLLFYLGLLKKYPGLQVRGRWRKPTSREATLYARALLIVLLVDVGSKALFFRWDRPYQVELIKNFGLHSVFHPSAFESLHFILFLYFVYLFVVGALFFRFSNESLDRIWLISGTFALGGAIGLFGERLLFGGVHNSFYFAGPLMWICPPCASPHFASYAWTPADLFVHAAFFPVLVLFVSYFVPAGTSHKASV